jgi:hypothetical protein
MEAHDTKSKRIGRSDFFQEIGLSFFEEKQINFRELRKVV